MKKRSSTIILIINICLIILLTGRAALGLPSYDPPTVTIVADKTTAVCASTPITFTATTTNAGNTTVFIWRVNGNPAGTNSNTFITATLNDQDKVTCSIRDTGDPLAVGEFTSNTIIVSIKSSLTPTLTIDQATGPCAIAFTARPTNAGTAPVYQWTRNGGPAGTNSSTYIANNPVVGEVITCTLTNTTTCSIVPTVSKSITITSVQTTLLVSIESQASRSVCTGTPIDFKAVTNFDDFVGNGLSYDWKVNNNSVGVTTQAYTSSTLKDKDLVTCEVTAVGNCLANPKVTTSPTPANIIQEVIPVVAVTADIYTTCAGSTVNFTASAAPLINPTFRWLKNGTPVGNDSPNFSTTDLKTGDIVTCTVNNQSGCSTPITAQAPTNLTIYEAPTIVFDNNTTITIGGQITLNPVITGNIISYNWSPAIGLSSTTSASTIASPASTTTYQLQVTTDKNCTTTMPITVYVIATVNPVNTFTPNADGVNDTWKIPELMAYPNCSVDVFNRYGQAVFHSIGYGSAWDGTSNGAKLAAGTYFYIIDTKDGSAKISGSVTIIR